MKRILSLLLLTVSFSLFTAKAQDRHKIDSLQNELNKFELHKKQLGSKATPLMDSVKVNIFMQFCFEYDNNSKDTAKYYNEQCLAISKRIGYKKGIANAYFEMGRTYASAGNYPEALKNILTALNIRKELGDKKDIGHTYNWLGIVYDVQGNYTEALKNLIEALKMSEELRDTDNIAHIKRDIGILYNRLGNYSEALKYIQASLKIFEEEGADLNRIGSCYNLIGENYFKQKKYDDALKNYNTAIESFNKTEFRAGMSMSYFGTGSVYSEMSNYPEALKNCFSAIKLAEDEGDKYSFARYSNTIGKIYEKQGNLQEALKYESNGLSIFMEIGSKDMLKDSYEGLAELNARLGNFKAAYDDEVLFKQTYDTIYNKDNEKKLTGLQMQYDFDKIQDSTKAEQGKKDLIATNEIRLQKNVRNYTLLGLGIVLLFSIVVFRQRNNIRKGKKRSDELLLNILPEEVAEELKEKGSADAKMFDDVTVMFTDFKGFTTIAEKLSAKDLVGEINYCFSAFDNIIHKYGIEKIKTIGDSYMAVGGLPVENKTHAKDVVKAALEISKFMEELKQQRIKEGKEIFEIRIGIHTGPVVAGIVGIKKFAYDIWGDTVNLASRMENSGEAGKVNISGSTYELVKNDFTCTYRGKIQAKNKGEVDMYFVG